MNATAAIAATIATAALAGAAAGFQQNAPATQPQPAVTTAAAPAARVTASAAPAPSRHVTASVAPKAAAAAPVHHTTVAPAHHVAVAPAPKPTAAATPVHRASVAPAPKAAAAAPAHRVTAVRTASRPSVTCAGVWAEALRLLPVRGPLNLHCGPTPTGAPGFSEASWSAPGHVTSANSWVDLTVYPGDERRDVQLAVHELMHQRVWHATAAQQQQVFRLLGTTADGYGQSTLPYLRQPAEALAASTARVLAGAPQSGYRAIPTSTVRAIVAATA